MWKGGDGQKAIPLSDARPQIQSFLDALPFHVLLIDAEHTIIAANAKMSEELQSSSLPLSSSHCPLVAHLCDSPIVDCPLAEALERGEAMEREIFNSRENRWIRAAVFPTSLVNDSGHRIYLHFARDISAVRQTEEKLSQSLEHHSALSELLQRFQSCQTGADILDALIAEITSLSWLGTTDTALGFLVQNGRLELSVQHNIAPELFSLCHSVKFGECLCGKAAETGRSIVCSSTSSEHTAQFEGMSEHRHAIFPISHEGKVLAVITLYLKSADLLSPFQLDFLNAAVSAAGVALGAQLTREELKRIRERSVGLLISYQEDERKHVARELHDQVCQSLSALLLKMQSHGRVEGALGVIQQDCMLRIRALIDEIRRMAVQLRPTVLDDYGLERALASYVADLSAASGIPIDYQYSTHPDLKRLPASLEIALYRIAAEALSNVVSHAYASRASVVVLQRHSKLTLLVEDDGCGFDYDGVRANMDRCRGVLGMETRVALMGGKLQIESSSGHGTTVRAEVPIEEQQ